MDYDENVIAMIRYGSYCESPPTEIPHKPMSFIDTYHKFVEDRKLLTSNCEIDRINYYTLGLTGEAGEIANQVKKIIRDDFEELTEERRAKIIDELGDLVWYCFAFATELGTDIEEVINRNIAKLMKRTEKGTMHGDGDDR